MRRIALLAAVLTGLGAWLTSFAGADDTHTYHIEMYNAFGIVDGSDVRIAGVNAGSVTELSITPEKRADLTIETSGPVGVLGKNTRCASQPQSLIAEYFLTCNPKGPTLPDGGTIPASQVTETVQPDLVQNTLREPYKDRLAILINEFGTALAGNPDDLNEAIRLGAPALRKLQAALDILADQNRTIRDLNANSDEIIAQLANRRQDVVRFIQESRDAAAISASRRADLSTDFNRLDDFFAELRPTLAKLGVVAQQQKPLLTNLRLAAPGLNTLAEKLPAFNEASDRSLTSLGEAAIPGRQALKQGKDEIQALAKSGRNAYPAVNTLDKFLLDLDSPKRVVEIDERAARACDNKRASCWNTGRPGPTGYTGFEGLLNYVYYQAGAINNYDQYGHVLHVPIYDFGVGPCGGYNSGDSHHDDVHSIGVPDKSGEGTTTSFADANECVSWIGDSQPGIGGPGSDIPEPMYDSSVCPNGSTDLSLCVPPGEDGAAAANGTAGASGSAGTAPESSGPNTVPGAPTVPPTGEGPPSVEIPGDVPGTANDIPGRLRDILGLGDRVGRNRVPDVGGALRRHSRKPGGARRGVGSKANHLLNYLFAP
jgi:virulence factor Mce-like protein